MVEEEYQMVQGLAQAIPCDELWMLKQWQGRREGVQFGPQASGCTILEFSLNVTTTA